MTTVKIMVKNYFALYALTLELKSLFEGGYVFESFSQEKNELRIGLISNDKRRFTLSATANAARLALHFSEDAARRARNTASLFRTADDKQIRSVRISNGERIVYFELEDNLSLAFQLFSADTNFFLLQNGIVLDAFKDSAANVGKEFIEKNRQSILVTLESLATDSSRFAAALAPFGATDLVKHLPKVLLGFDAYLSREAVQRAKMFHHTSPLENLHEAVQEIFYELLSPEPKVYYAENAVWFSIVADTHNTFERVETFDSINEAMKTYAHRAHQLDRFGKELVALKKSTAKLTAKTAEQLRALQEQSVVNRAQKYEQFGQLLLMNLTQLQRGAASIDLENIFAENAIETIPLDIKKTPQENAEMYFEKAKKSRQNTLIAQKRLSELKTWLLEQQRLVSELETVERPKDLKAWREKNLEWLKKFSLISKEEAEKERLFRRFQIAEHIELWVGKNAKNNDLLTFKHAKPNELWFHARGVSGSHCVLKTSRKPSKDDILRAAQIAAYYSSARSSEYVPVICTEKKFVRKPKGAPPGSVTVEREEVVIVKPQLNGDDAS